MKFGRTNKVNAVAATTTTASAQKEECDLFSVLSGSSNAKKSETAPTSSSVGRRPHLFGGAGNNKTAQDACEDSGVVASVETKKSGGGFFKRANKPKREENAGIVEESREEQTKHPSKGGIFQRNHKSTKQEQNNVEDESTSKKSIGLFKRNKSGAEDEFKMKEDEFPKEKEAGTKKGGFFARRNKGADAEEREAAPNSKSADDKRTQIRAVYSTFGQDASKLLQVEQDEAPPELRAENHVLVKVQASTVTLNDCLLRRGFDNQFLDPASLPVTPGMDVVGTISKIGGSVTEFATGDRVAALVRTGGNARYISVPEASLVKIPNSLDSGEAAAVISIYSTAFYCLKVIARGGPMYSLEGKKVLILGGMDGVGRALVQMCKKSKAEIYFAAPNHWHLYVKNILGATPLPETDWLAQVEGSLDYVFDGICEDGSTNSMKALKKEGELVCYGQSALLQENEMGVLGPPMLVHWKNIVNAMSSRVHTVDVWSQFRRDPAAFKDDLKTLFQSLKSNKMSPHIAKRVALTGVGAAQTKLEKGDIRGTIVCFPWRPVRASKMSQQNQEG